MIRKLDPNVANKIAAGEVVERPASVVKELVENALDAGATRISVELEEGGSKLIRVTDDGRGIAADDLELAFASHATSKINRVEDLFQVVTYGFRGEALASIGSVSRASIVSRPPGSSLGNRIECEAGALTPVMEAGGPEGTVVEVRDLFHNTPVRRKFLKRDSAEVSRANEILTRTMLPLAGVSARLEHDGRKVMSCDRAAGLEDRVLDLFGADLRGRLLAVRGRSGGITVEGLLGTPDVARKAASRQYMFVNDRFVKDRGLSHAVARAFEGFLMPKFYPMFFLQVTIDPSTVDVNVHPTKIEVRFRERDAVYSSVFHACRTALEQGAPVATWSRPGGTGGDGGGQVAEAVEQPGLPVAEAAGVSTAHQKVSLLEQQLYPGGVPTESVERAGACSHKVTAASVADTDEYRCMQIHDSYILVEDAEGFHIVDQHALHERMLFDELLERSGRGEVEVQNLLVPEIVEVSPAEKTLILDMVEDLSVLGFEVEDFSGNGIAVQAVPLDMAGVSAARLMEGVLALREEQRSTGFEDRRRALLAGMACRAAVKFNERLPEAQIRTLLEWQRRHPEATSCAHGRPTRLAISLSELEYRFLRKE